MSDKALHNMRELYQKIRRSKICQLHTETPDNFNEIGTFVEKEINGIKKKFSIWLKELFL